MRTASAARPESPGRVGSPPAPPAADQRGRVWEPSQGSHEENQLVKIVAFMLVRVGGRWFALPAHMVQQVAVKRAVTRVPTAARHVLGVTSLRGSLVPVVSLEQMIGVVGPAASDSATTLPRLVVVRAGECEIALVVDEIRGIIDELPAAPGLKAGGAGRPVFLREEFDWQGTRVCVLDVALLVAAAAGWSQEGG